MDPNNSYNHPQQNEDSIDLRKWVGKIFSNWYWFVFSVMVFGGGAYMLTKYIPASYKVESTILVKDDNQAIGAEVLFNEFNFGGSGRKLENEIQKLKSWSLARRTLEELNFDISFVAVGRWSEQLLYENLPLRVVLGPNSEKYQDIPIYVSISSDSTFQLRIYEYNINETRSFNEPFVYEDFSFILSPNPNFHIEDLPEVVQTGDYYFLINDLDKLAADYVKDLEADWVDQDASVIKLSLTGYSALKEADYLNALMSEYIEMGLEEKNKTASNTVNFIDEQLAGIVDSVRLAGENLSTFRSQNKVISLTAAGQEIYDKLSQYTKEKALADKQVSYYEDLLEYINNSETFTDILAPSTMGIDDQMLTSVITRLVELSTRKTSLEYSATENSQALKTLNLEIKFNRDQLVEIVENILAYAVLNQEDVDRRMKQLNAEIKKLPETERQFLNIERKFKMADEIYAFLSQKKAEAAIAEASNVPDQLIVDSARVDAAEQVNPKKTMNYAIGGLLGLLLPFIILVLADFLNTRIREKEDVEGHTDIPIIGSVGHNKREIFIPTLKYPRSSIAESFRAIRTDLQFVLYKENKKVIMVTSTTAGEGKSFVSMNLAGIFSVTEKKTVVVGLDLRLPVIHKYMNVDNTKGVTTHVIGKHSLEEIIYPSGHPNLYYIPAGPPAPNPAELIQTQAFVDFIENLKTKFDMVILDTPPVALVTDSSLIARHSDASIYIVRQNFTQKSAITFINKFAEKEHVNNINIVINDVVVPKYYGYKYGYGYGYGYGKGYGSGYYIEE